MLEESPDDASAGDGAERVTVNEPKTLANITENANLLPAQRWAVVAAHGEEGDRLCDLVGDLVRKRAEDQKADVLTVRVPPGMDREQAAEWLVYQYPKVYRSERERPSYLCILGDVDQVSLETEQALAVDGLPGRLVCADEDGYQAYVEKLLRWETQPPEHARPLARFYTVHDGTRATRSGHRKLALPCFALARSDWDSNLGDGHFRSLQPELVGDDDDPDPTEFLTMAGAQTPSVMFSISHGMGPPRDGKWSRDEAREGQGAMVFGTEGTIRPRDIAGAKAFLPGGFWFYFACFGAGTPSRSAYYHWLDSLASLDEGGMGNLRGILAGLDRSGGFTSGVAKAALAHPNGPLGMIGHIDLAWSYGFEEIRVKKSSVRRGRETSERYEVTGKGRAEDYYSLLSRMVEGQRLGASFLQLKMALTRVSKELNECYDRNKERGVAAEGEAVHERKALSHTWMRRQDLRGYALLGDPAARLPLKLPQATMLKWGLLDVALPEPPSETELDLYKKQIESVEYVIGGKKKSKEVYKRAGFAKVDEFDDYVKAYREAGQAALIERLRDRQKT